MARERESKKKRKSILSHGTLFLCLHEWPFTQLILASRGEDKFQLNCHMDNTVRVGLMPVSFNFVCVSSPPQVKLCQAVRETWWVERRERQKERRKSKEKRWERKNKRISGGVVKRKEWTVFSFLFLPREVSSTLLWRQRREKSARRINHRLTRTTSCASCGLHWEGEKKLNPLTLTLFSPLKSLLMVLEGWSGLCRVFLFNSHSPNIAWVAVGVSSLSLALFWRMCDETREEKETEKEANRENALQIFSSEEAIASEWNCTGGIECDVHLRVKG